VLPNLPAVFVVPHQKIENDMDNIEYAQRVVDEEVGGAGRCLVHLCGLHTGVVWVGTREQRCPLTSPPSPVAASSWLVFD
jgi:hypothetical protein